MLNWIRRKLFNRSRNIFRYWDGQRFIRDDPQVLYRKLATHSRFEWDVHTQLIDQDDESREIVLDATREIFHIQKFDPETERGLTEEETFNLLWSFMNYCHSKKKNTNPSPTPQPSTESATSADSATSSGSDFGSISPESKFDMPPVF